MSFVSRDPIRTLGREQLAAVGIGRDPRLNQSRAVLTYVEWATGRPHHRLPLIAANFRFGVIPTDTKLSCRRTRSPDGISLSAHQKCIGAADGNFRWLHRATDFHSGAFLDTLNAIGGGRRA
jgi:hypothetical protein